MRALCVTAARTLAVRDIPEPADAAPGHVLVDIDSCAINHGDRTFLARPDAAGRLLSTGPYDVWGASGAGTVVATGAGVAPDLVGRPVAVYRSLRRSEHSIGLWCERAHVPAACCVALPTRLRPRERSGSLVNMITALAFLERIRADGHRAVIATAGRSATGLALAVLAEQQGMPTILLARGSDAAPVPGLEAARVLATGAADFEPTLATLAAERGATAVFDGVGGGLLSRIMPLLPRTTAIHCYGFLDGAEPVAFPTALLMNRSLTLERFSNFDSETVTDPARLDAARARLAAVIDHPLFATRIGRTFDPERIEDAMAFEAGTGAKAVLLFRP